VTAYYAAMTKDHRLPTSGLSSGASELDEFRALVRAAFEQALDSGKSDWMEMTSAVLKNRLLSLTDRQFSESRYGSLSFIQLVRRVPDLLDVVDETPPFRLRIKVSEGEQNGVSPPSDDLAEVEARPDPASPRVKDWKRVRIRDDLWRAIIDYDSGAVYVLDAETGYARPREVTDPDLPEFPTTTSGEVAAWRREFVEMSIPLVGVAHAEELLAWADGGGRQSDLPRSVRGRWVEYVKKQVVRTLETWFRARNQHPPVDMLLASEARGLPQSDAIDDVIRTRQLRDLIIRAVRTMTYEELAGMPLPAGVLLRFSGRATGQVGQDG
jgi:hypothetical protein